MIISENVFLFAHLAWMQTHTPPNLRTHTTTVNLQPITIIVQALDAGSFSVICEYGIVYSADLH